MIVVLKRGPRGPHKRRAPKAPSKEPMVNENVAGGVVPSPPPQRGFASMDEDKQKWIASKGGRSVAPEKRSFSQDHDLARKAGRKGGNSFAPEDRSFSQNRDLAAEAGRKGGLARAERMRSK